MEALIPVLVLVLDTPVVILTVFQPHYDCTEVYMYVIFPTGLDAGAVYIQSWASLVILSAY